jgi:hypothetical protein
MPDPKIILAVALVGLAALVGRVAIRRDAKPLPRILRWRPTPA